MERELHIFNAGPSLLPREVLEDAAGAVMDFGGSGIPLLCTSHRSKEWNGLMDETRALWRELLAVPDGYQVVLFSGGATMGFLLAAMNFLERKAAYLDTGIWAHKALKEAQGIGDAYAIASSREDSYNHIPKGFVIPHDLDYLHVTTNNTVYGTEIREDIDSPVPLVADMSSDILSRPVDVSRYAMIYGSAQKNAGTAGVAFAIVKTELLGRVSRHIPTLLDLRTYVDNGSMPNTPPVFPIYVMNRTLRWILARGGVAAMQASDELKAGTLYAEIDRNPLFEGTAAVEDRSVMNVCFRMAAGNEGLEERFLAFSQECGIVGIKGYRTVGGFRASIYNACSQDDVDALVKCMQDFEQHIS